MSAGPSFESHVQQERWRKTRTKTIPGRAKSEKKNLSTDEG
jgi:hypothetical protein